jgi:hypothetical protein
MNTTNNNNIKQQQMAVYQPIESGEDGGLRRANLAVNTVERSEHVDRVKEAVAAAGTVSSVKTLLLEGERGSGKSVLISQVRVGDAPAVTRQQQW